MFLTCTFEDLCRIPKPSLILSRKCKYSNFSTIVVHNCFLGSTRLLLSATETPMQVYEKKPTTQIMMQTQAQEKGKLPFLSFLSPLSFACASVCICLKCQHCKRKRKCKKTMTASPSWKTVPHAHHARGPWACVCICVYVGVASVNQAFVFPMLSR